MSQKSLAVVMLMGIRAAGRPTYYPAHVKPDGTKVNARCEVSCYVNDFYIDANGNRVDSSDVIRLVGWNSNSSAPGKGLADTMAKYIAPGKELSCQAQINTYQGRVFDANDNALQYADGTPIMTKRISFIIEPRTLRLGDDSEKLLQAEFAQFQANGGMMSFDSRPIDWRTPGSLGAQQWTGISAWRSSQVFQPGLPTYGYAQVGAITGTAVSAHASAPVAAAAPAPVAGTAVVAGPAVAAPIAAPVAAPAAVVAAPAAV